MSWRRWYLALIAIRFFFAFCPSYIHPDEHFQGLEIVTGDAFKWNIHKTWEFTSTEPIRSVLPLWYVYRIPLEVMKWINQGPPSPTMVYYALRLGLFVCSILDGDLVLWENASNQRQTQLSLLLISSSYVTWTYQVHTFSNSIETFLLVWSLLHMERIQRIESGLWDYHSALLGVTVVMGVFNRITFPLWLLLPGIPLLTLYWKKCVDPQPGTAGAIYLDTIYYNPEAKSIWDAVITPWNNIKYNSQIKNLAVHGLHPFWTHSLVNLPQLIGPAMLSLHTLYNRRHSISVQAAVSGITLLSLFRHQEARFLIPAIPLLLSNIRLPLGNTSRKLWIASWLLFNLGYGTLMGVYHQGGVVPAQLYIGKNLEARTVVWWKTYSPPTWLLARSATTNYPETVDLMGASTDKLDAAIEPLATCSTHHNYLVAPLSAVYLDKYINNTENTGGLYLEQVKVFRRHFNMDDLDFGDEGVVGTIKRVVGRRGLGIWEIRRNCEGRILKKVGDQIMEDVLGT